MERLWRGQRQSHSNGKEAVVEVEVIGRDMGEEERKLFIHSNARQTSLSFSVPACPPGYMWV